MLDFNFVLKLSERDTDINFHLGLLYTIPFVMGAETIVELGSGQSTYVLAAVASMLKADFYSIDLYENSHLRSFPEGEGLLEQESCYHKIIGDDMEIIKTWENPIDFLFLDTSHTYEHTKEELNSWTTYIKAGGVLAMHDTNHTDPISKGCRIALEEFLEENKNYKAIHFPNRFGFSILKKKEGH